MVSLYFVALQFINAVVAVGLYVLLQRWLTHRKTVAARRVEQKALLGAAEVQHRGDSATDTVGLVQQDALSKESPARHTGSHTRALPDVFVPEPSMLDLPSLPSDWAIRPDQIEISRRPNGTYWELGTGAFGKVAFYCLAGLLSWLYLLLTT